MKTLYLFFGRIVAYARSHPAVFSMYCIGAVLTVVCMISIYFPLFRQTNTPTLPGAIHIGYMPIKALLPARMRRMPSLTRSPPGKSFCVPGYPPPATADRSTAKGAEIFSCFCAGAMYSFSRPCPLIYPADRQTPHCSRQATLHASARTAPPCFSESRTGSPGHSHSATEH